MREPRRTDIWMPLYIGEYLADTMGFTTEQHGAYLRILMACWREKGNPISGSDKDLATVAGLTPARWRDMKVKLLAKFIVAEDGSITHKRAKREVERAEKVSKARSEAGKNGASARWDNEAKPMTRAQRLAEARSRGRHTPQEWAAMQEVFGHRCVHCSIHADELEGGALTKDHVTPLYQGGDDSIENIQPSCRNCNSKKGSDCTDRRETACKDWRKRMTELLAKRLANASQTPGQSQSQVTRDSVPYGTGSEPAAAAEPAGLFDPAEIAGSPVPPPPAPQPPSDRDRIFAEGVPLLTAAAVSEKHARSMLASLANRCGDAAVVRALTDCAIARPVQPVSWLQARLKAAPAGEVAPRAQANQNRYGGAAAAIFDGATHV